MRTLTRSFAQGLLVLAPVGITLWIVVVTVTTLDRWLNTPIPGLGIVVAAAGITLIGYLTRNVVGTKLLDWLEAGMQRVPLIRILYNSLRDLFGAFVGGQRRFDKPVVVDIDRQGVKVLGFLTADEFDDPQLADHVSVYLPESYNFAGNLIVVPKDRVRPLDADGAEFMAFIVSGGITAMTAGKTAVDPV